MGTWGVAAFDNDDAMDYLPEVIEDGPPALQEAFAVVLDQEGYLESPEGARAVAAAEIVAANLTGDSSHISDGALQLWLEGRSPGEFGGLRDLALQALERIEAPDSELKALWAEGESESWHAELERIGRALRAAGAGGA